MFPLLPFPTTREVILFALVISRVAGMFSALPVFGGRRLPLQIRVVAIIAITLACFPILTLTPPPMPGDTFALGLLALREVMIGLTLSFITQIIFSAVEFSGQIIGMQMGFTIAAIIDPTHGTQTQVMSVMQSLLATLMFLALNIHHLFIRAIVDSFRIIPLGVWHLNEEIISFLTRATAEIFVLGVRLAAPVMVALLLTSVVLGIMARAFPQMNVFMISFPLNIGIGFIVLGLTLPMFFHVLEVSFGSAKGQIETLFHLMAKGG
jgi:flagellar biosynthetic protein FliR